MQHAAELTSPEQSSSTTSLALRFAIATAAAECLAVGLTSLTSELLSAFGPPSSGAGELLLLACMALAGAVEGTILGTAQWLAIRPFVRIRHNPAVGFVVLTALAVAAYWTAGIVLSGIEPEGVDSPWLECAIVACAGAGLGTLIGLAHLRALKGALRTPARYLALSAIGWSIGLAVAWVGARGVPTDERLIVAVSQSAFFGAISGFVAGGLAGLGLAKQLLDRD